MKNPIFDAAMELGRAANYGEACTLIANDVWDCVKNHALIAVGALGYHFPEQTLPLWLVTFGLCTFASTINITSHSLRT